MTKDSFHPHWRETPPVPGSYRSIFKWGKPDVYKHPGHKFLEEIKKKFSLDDGDFLSYKTTGDEKVSFRRKINLREKDIHNLQEIAGIENIQADEYSRLKYSTGKTIEEAINLRHGMVSAVTDAVIHPISREMISEIVRYCSSRRIPVYVYGGGSSVNLGLMPEKGGVTLVMNTHMNRILDLNEINQTVTVEAGITGAELEHALNNAPEILETGRRYTCGHFPQSFEYSTAGGWISTYGSGQASSYYGDACDLAVSQEHITPAGIIRTGCYPATATGPKVNDMLKGSEGTLGVLTEVTLKIFRYMPENRKRFGFIFPSFRDAVNACREVSQAESGMPAVFRISDEEETHTGLKMYGIGGTVFDMLMRLRGFTPMKRCLLIGTSEGGKLFTGTVMRQVKRICRKNGGMYITGLPAKLWEPGRYTDPYMREDLHDYGIIIDTLETAVMWDRLHRVHGEVRQYIKSRPETICMAHSSHFYPQGTNLYFIFIMKDRGHDDYVKFQRGIIDTICKSGGSLSHHHGVGRMMSPWMEQHLGKVQMDILRAVKKHLDPNNIMNPGGQMGLDVVYKKRRG